MTLSRVGDGTASFAPAGPGAQIDAFGLKNPALNAPYQSVEGGARFKITNVEQLPDGGERRYWRLELYDMRLGFRQRGRFERDHGAVASSTMSHYFEEQAVLPFLTSGTTALNPTLSGPPGYQQHTANIFNTCAFALRGAAAQSYLYKETSVTDPTIIQITYAKGNGIGCLQPVVVNSIDYLAVGLFAQGVDLLSNLTTGGPTSLGQMNALTNNCTGIIQTFLPGNPLLIDAGGQLLTVPGNVVYSTVPTVALTLWPTGGYALGLKSLGGGPVRAWWLKATTNNGYYIPGSINSTTPYVGKVISTAQDGTTPQVLDMTLDKAHHAALYRDGIVASDENRVVFHNGRFIRDLHIFRDVAANSDKLYKVANFYVNGPALWAEVNIIASPSGTGNTQRAVWYYDYDQDAWFQVSATATLGGTGMQSFSGVGNVSFATGFLHIFTLTDHKFSWQFQPPFGVNPYNYRKTSGAQASTGQEYEASGVMTPTLNELPGLEGLPKIIRRVEFMGDVDAGGTGGTPAKVNVTAPGIDTSTHADGDFVTARSVNGLQQRDFEDNGTSFYKFAPTITATRQSGGTDPTRFTPQILPIAFEGYADSRPWYAPPTREEVNT